MRASRLGLAAALAIGLGAASRPAAAQRTTLAVLDAGGQPVPFAVVSVDGGRVQIVDPDGRLALSVAAGSKVKLAVRRIGFRPWESTVTLGADSLLAVRLERLSQKLDTMRITERAGTPNLMLATFYQRALDRQRGLGTGVFITPEEIEKRDPSDIAQLFTNQPSVRLAQAYPGHYTARGANSTCDMTVLVDGQVANRSPLGGGKGMSIAPRPAMNNGRVSADDLSRFTLEDVEADNVAAIEIYARGSSVPAELQVSDQACGVIAIWTGARK